MTGYWSGEYDITHSNGTLVKHIETDYNPFDISVLTREFIIGCHHNFSDNE